MKLKLPRRASRSGRSKLPPLPSAWFLFKRALRDFRAHWWGYLKVLAVVVLPVNLLYGLALTSSASAYQAYSSFLTIVMNVAFLWTIVRTQASGRVPKVHEAYYDGTAPLVRFILVSLALVVFLIPLAFGLALWVVALKAADYYGGFGPESPVLGLLAAIFALPSLYLVGRYLLAMLAVVREGSRPLAALRLSRRLTLGRFWPVTGRLILLLLFLAIVAVPALGLAFGLSGLHQAYLAFVTFQIVASFTVLPVTQLYLLQLYLALEAAPAAGDAPQPHK